MGDMRQQCQRQQWRWAPGRRRRSDVLSVVCSLRTCSSRNHATSTRRSINAACAPDHNRNSCCKESCHTCIFIGIPQQQLPRPDCGRRDDTLSLVTDAQPQCQRRQVCVTCLYCGSRPRQAKYALLTAQLRLWSRCCTRGSSGGGRRARHAWLCLATRMWVRSHVT
jgi:hypothetical protein